MRYSATCKAAGGHLGRVVGDRGNARGGGSNSAYVKLVSPQKTFGAHPLSQKGNLNEFTASPD